MYRPTRDTTTVRGSVPEPWVDPVSDEQGATITVTAPPAKGDKRTGEQKRIEDLFQAVNPGDSIKIRHQLADDKGKHIRPLTAILRDFAGVTDLEQHIYDTGCVQGWKSGDYMIELCRPGQQGAVKYGFFSFTFPERPAAATAVDPLAVLERAKGILGAAPPPASADATLSAVTQAMKVGAESAGKNGSGETLTLLKPVLEKLVDRLMTPPPPAAAPPDPLVQMRSVLGALRELGLIGDQGGSGEEPRSLREQLTEVRELAETLGLSARGAAPDPAAVQIAKIFAPVAEKVVPQILATVNNVVDVWRMRMALGPGAVGAPRAIPAGPPPIPLAITELAHAAQAAIARDDDGFFGAFVQGVAEHVPDGRAFIAAIQARQVEEEQALAAIGTTGLLNPADPATRAWLLRCVHWLQTRKPLAEAPPPATAPRVEEVRGHCETCHALYTFPGGMAEYQADTRICDNPVGEAAADELCKGNIALGEPPA